MTNTSITEDIREMHNQRVLVVGSGPSGLAVAACLQRENVLFDLVDRSGTIGGAYRLIRPDLTLLSLARNVGLPGLRFISASRYPTVLAYRDYLQRYADVHRLQTIAAEVARIDRVGNLFEVQFTKSELVRSYGAVVVATGMFSSPFNPHLPGLINLPLSDSSQISCLHSSNWLGPGTCIGRRVLVVGGGTSGVEISESCAARGIRVMLSVKRRVRLIPKNFLGIDLHNLSYHLLQFAPAWFLADYCSGRLVTPPVDRGFRRFCRAGLISLAGPICGFADKTAVFADGRQEIIDVVIFATGYRFDYPFLPRNVLPIPQGALSRNPGRTNWWPGLFVIGYRCMKTASSEFLRGIAKDAPIVARNVRNHLRELNSGNT
jgi:putative flavoprotein involved in K+ transport